MKAIIQTELLCGCCGTPMQWSTISNNADGQAEPIQYVACRQLKCEERNVKYDRPTVVLVKIEADQPKEKRKYTRKDVKG